MNGLIARRLTAVSGLVLAATAAVWWLGSTRLALDAGTDAGRTAAEALYALSLVRGMALAVFGVRIGALYGWRPGIDSALGLVAPSWPVMLLLWSASASPMSRVFLMEALLLGGSFALPLVGLGLRRWLGRTEFAVVTGTAIGVVLAALVWAAREFAIVPLP